MNPSELRASLSLAAVFALLAASSTYAGEPFALDVRKRTETGEGSGRFHAVAKPETWNPGALQSMACIVKAVQRTEETLEDLERYYGEQYANYLYRKAPDSAASTPPPSAVIGT